MATGKRGGGPGTYTEKGVVCTMNAPFKKGMGTGEQHDMSGTFDHPRTGGGNGLPTTVTASLGNESVPSPGSAAKAPSKDMDGMKTY